MTHNEETRRTGKCGRASELVLCRNSSEHTVSPLQLQAAFVASRFALGEAVSRVVAEHAFAGSATR